MAGRIGEDTAEESNDLFSFPMLDTLSSSLGLQERG